MGRLHYRKVSRRQLLPALLWVCGVCGLLGFEACVSGKQSEPQVAAGPVAPAASLVPALPAPEENRFVKQTLAQGLREPMELAVTPGNDVFWVERKGSVHYFQAATKKTFRLKVPFDVFAGNNDGLLGITVDPDYRDNKFVYLYFSPAGDTARQHLARFVFNEQHLELTDQRVLLKIPTQRQECCHSGGGLAFGPDATLYIGVGDNVSPKVQDGYSPLDEQPGRAAFDAQGTSANTQDLRGKVLRIKPQPDGSYTIPEGNLFPKDGSQGRPEIYAMGARNPIRLSVDAKTGYLYFGDIGPDANVAGPRGPEAYDEVNLAKKPGNFGWPYFVGNNRAYPKYDFATGAIGPVNNPAAPVNTSPHNTGARVLPPIQAPMIYYSFAVNPAFPSLGTGGRSAMAGPVYRYQEANPSPNKFPAYYDGVLFIHDWMRDWVKAVRLDAEGHYSSLEDFMPTNGFSSPMDLAFGADGALYVLEYGKGWYSDNPDARLVKVSYISGNRPPVVQAAASVTDGALPLRVAFSSAGTKDLDGDLLHYEWRLADTMQVSSREANPTFTFTRPGIYHPTLLVTDSQGNKAQASLEIVAGNTRPQLAIEVSGNTTFYWPGEQVKYQVQVKDAEDGSLAAGKIRPAAVQVFLEYAAGGDNLSPLLMAGQKASAAEAELLNHPGKVLIDQSDCRNCHAPDKNSIGPSYQMIARRYAQDAGALERLAAKIIQGGGGVWKRPFVMVGHPNLSARAATEMVKYIYTFAEEKPQPRRLAPAGGLSLAPPRPEAAGAYYLMASYQDQGGPGSKPLEAKALHILRAPRLQAEHYAGGLRGLKVIGKLEDGDSRYLGEIGHQAQVHYQDLDLTRVGSLTLQYAGTASGSSVAVRLDSPTGELIGSTAVPPTGGTTAWQQTRISLKEVQGRHDVYLVFLNDQKPKSVMSLDWLCFNVRKEGLEAKKSH